jgi:hypothetical protein
MNTTEQPTAPAGYRQNAHGHLIPIDQIKEIDLARDELVNEIVTQAKAISGTLRKFRDQALDDSHAFVQLSAEKYGSSIGGKKGNLSLHSFDGRYRLDRAIADSITFDERLQAAKSLIDQCLNEWSQTADPKIKTVIQSAFETDAKGNVATHKVLELRRIKISDPAWEKAMEAIADAINITGSKTYIRLYERDEHGRYNQIPLDPNKL